MSLFWHNESGFDSVGYVRLERMASMLRMPRLEGWIAKERFKQALKIQVEVVPVEWSLHSWWRGTKKFCFYTLDPTAVFPKTQVPNEKPNEYAMAVEKQKKIDKNVLLRR